MDWESFYPLLSPINTPLSIVFMQTPGTDGLVLYLEDVALIYDNDEKYLPENLLVKFSIANYVNTRLTSNIYAIL